MLCHHLQYYFNGIIVHYPSIWLSWPWGYQVWVVPLCSHHILSLQLSTWKWAAKDSRNGRFWAWLLRQLALTQVPSHLGLRCWSREPDHLSQGRIEQRKLPSCPENPRLVCSPVTRPRCGRVQFISLQQFNAYSWLWVKKCLKITSICKPVNICFPHQCTTACKLFVFIFIPMHLSTESC